MRTLLVTIATVAALLAPAHAIGKGRIESAKKRAAAENKLVAFVVEQDYWDPACPKCVAAVDGNNGTIKRIAPNKNVVVIRLEESDLKKGNVPDCVVKASGMPRVVITDAGCTKAIDTLGTNADKARLKQMEEKIAAALAK